ncbi:MAG: PEP-CTERM sorting domain-containing protein [Pedosphaera sp.]|nr:PEP-CTERM sorting domain-containing protein [Pedosphaera sp.]
MKFRIILTLVASLAAAHAAPLGFLVPAYFYPGSLWTSMNYAATRAPLIAILNPNSGPDTTQNPDYVAAVNSLRAAGGKVIGYVYTSYGARATNAVRTDIDRYYSFYAMDGIFLDEVTNDANTNHLNYYAALYQYIKSKSTNALVVCNPGINTLESYLAPPVADVVVTFEGYTGYASYTPDAWVTNHLARHFCHLPYNVTDATTMTNYVNLAVSRNAGWIYITNDKGTNPWDTLPSYWTNEVEFVRALNLSRARDATGALRRDEQDSVAPTHRRTGHV